MATEDRDINNLSEDEDDSEDEDFVPGNESDASEEECEGDPEDEEQLNSNGSKKRKSKGSKGKRKRSKYGKDEDSLANQSQIESPDEDDPEKKLRDEAAEKERNNKIYADFLQSVDDYSKNKTLGTAAKPEAKVTKVYEFAGEIVKVSESASKSSTNGHLSSSRNGLISGKNGTSQKLTLLPTRGPQPRKHGITFLSGDPSAIGLGSSSGKKGAVGGITAVLNAMRAKKRKIGTLQKSKMDWESFKKDQGIEEELKTHVKGKDGYLERQEFLNRADYRQFEIEREMRAKNRKTI